MNETEWTPEPWVQWVEHGNIFAVSGDVRENTRAVFSPAGRMIADFEQGEAAGEFEEDEEDFDERAKDVDIANARRACAAVNACAGISTTDLENGAVSEMRTSLGALLKSLGPIKSHARVSMDYSARSASSHQQFINEDREDWAEFEGAVEAAKAALAKATERANECEAHDDKYS